MPSCLHTYTLHCIPLHFPETGSELPDSVALQETGSELPDSVALHCITVHYFAFDHITAHDTTYTQNMNVCVCVRCVCVYVCVVCVCVLWGVCVCGVCVCAREHL